MANLSSARELLQTCIETPSFSGREAALLRRLESIALKACPDVEVVRGDFGTMLIWEGRDNKKSPLYLFDAHADTVEVAESERDQWSEDPFKMRIVGDCVYGKGSADQIGGLVAGLRACMEVGNDTERSNRGISFGILLARAEELAEGWASRRARVALLNNGYTDLRGVISTEPSNGKVMVGQMGRLRLAVRTDDPKILSSLILDLNEFEGKVSRVTGKPQALTLIGGDLTTSFTGKVDSQVPDSASAQFAVNALSSGSFRSRFENHLRRLQEAGLIVGFNISVDRGVLSLGISGRTAHSAFPAQGVNAGVGLARVIEDIAIAFPELQFMHGQIGGGNLTPYGRGSLGEIFYDYRIDANEGPEDLVGIVRNRVYRVAPGRGACVGVHDQSINVDGISHPVYQYFPGWLLEGKESLLLSALRDAGNVADQGTWGFCTNLSGWVQEGNIPVIGLGPGNPELAHQPNEHTLLSQVEEVTLQFGSFLRNLAGT